MEGNKQRVPAAVVQKVIDGLRPDDEVALVVFAGRPEIAIRWTPARGVPPIDWAQWKAAGMTALVDAMRVGVDLMSEARKPKLAILVVSDGQETGSFTSFGRLVTTRRQSETMVYAVFLDELRSQYVLGYTPSKSPDGKYRRLRIETDDRTLKVRHRAGHLAMPTQ
jgi:Mg-chelatase subunit ChlD